MENYVNYTGNSPSEETTPAIIGNDMDKLPSSGDSNKMALTDENSKVKFTNANHAMPVDHSRNGEAKVEIEGIKVVFAGMGKEELMRFANDPFWIRLRWSLLLLFWFVWLAMLVGAIVIVVYAKRCDPLPTLDWWQRNVIYEVEPASFEDSDGDGNGDLRGIAKHVAYLDELGVRTLLLDSIYEADSGNGQGIINHTAIDPRYGTMEEFTDLMEALTNKDIKLVMVFMPAQTSTLSPWFEESRQGVLEYKDYYIWKDEIEKNGAMNKSSDAVKLSWMKDEVRNQFYMSGVHDQPALNLRSDDVKRELVDILKYWLDRGVSGFQVRGVQNFFPDEIPEKLVENKDNNSNIVEPFHSDETNGLLLDWRNFLTDYEEKNGGGHRLLILDTDQDLNTTLKYYGNETQTLVDFPINTVIHQALHNNPTGDGVTGAIINYMEALPSRAWPNWKIGGSEDLKINPQLIDGLHMITMLLIGTPITTSGEELGLMRLPEQDVNLNGTDAESIVELTIKNQSEKSHSHLKVFKHLVKLRKQDSIKFGSLAILNVSNQLVAFCRIKKGTPGFLVIVNFHNTSTSIDLSKISEISTKYGATESSNVRFKFPEDGTLELTSSNVPEHSKLYNLAAKVKPKLADINIGPYEAIVLKFVPNFIK